MDPSTVLGGVPNAPPSPQQPRNNRPMRGNFDPNRRGGRQGERGRGGPHGERGRGGPHRGRGRGFDGRQPLDYRAPRHDGRQLDNSNGAPPGQQQNTASLPGTGETIEGNQTKSPEDEVEAEVCFICASPVVHNSVAPCNHRTCHICALRMRALYKNKACMHCRTTSDYVVFTDDPNKRYEDFADDNFVRVDHNLGIKYESSEIFEDTVLLLRYNCPEESCDIACYGWPDLHKHVRTVHGKIMCDLCTRNKKVFTHEHTLFTHNELRKHEKFGDDNPGAVDQSGFKGHPECGFCKQRFYGDDELYVHCRDKHERCHICDRRSEGREQQYYLDYDALEVHFKKDHFLCPDSECMDKKFVVFESEMDLKAHQLEAHPNGLSKDARRDARRVDMSSFDYRAPHQEPRGGRREGREGREGRGRGRGRDPNTDALPLSSAQPMRRDEIAYQRQLAVHSAQSVSNRNFGGQLTTGDAYAARPAPTAQEPPTVTASRTANGASTDPVPAMSSLTIDPATAASNTTLTPQERARQLRHTAVIERATSLLHNDTNKLTTFRSKISALRTSFITAEALIDSFFTLFDTSASDLGKLIKEVADIFEVPGKRDELLKAWNDWRAINEDYPSLPGPNGLPAGGSTSAGSGGKRILKLKSSTVQSSRSAVSRHGSWGGTANGGSSTTPFPPMPTASSANRAGPGRVSATPWVTSAQISSANTPRASPAPSRPASTRPQALGAAPRGADAFPALPVAIKPGMNVSRPGYVGNPVIKGRSGTSTPVVNPWAGGAAGAGGLSAALDAAVAEGEAGGKGKGKKKQTLVHWG